MNGSGIHPQGNRILILPREVQEKTESGIILNTATGKDREDMSNTTGVVVEMGAGCFMEEEPWCAVEDKVVFAKYAGLLYLGKDGKKYRIINDNNIVATLDNDVELVDPYLVTKKYTT